MQHQVAHEHEARLAALGRDLRRCSTVIQPLDPEMARLLGVLDQVGAPAPARAIAGKR